MPMTWRKINLDTLINSIYSLDIAEFLKNTCEQWPFEMAIEFLSDQEKKGKPYLRVYYF